MRQGLTLEARLAGLDVLVGHLVQVPPLMRERLELKLVLDTHVSSRDRAIAVDVDEEGARERRPRALGERAEDRLFAGHVLHVPDDRRARRVKAERELLLLCWNQVLLVLQTVEISRGATRSASRRLTLITRTFCL